MNSAGGQRQSETASSDVDFSKVAMRCKIPLLAALVFLSPVSALGQLPRDHLRSNCQDENMTDRCDPDVQRSVRETYGLQSIEALAAAGADVRRAFFVDGYGVNMPVIAFERRPGADPQVTVSVRVENGAGGARLVVMSSPVPLQAWNELLAETRHFDRELVPLSPARTGGVEEICLHPWVVTVEAADRAADRAIRRRTENACNDGLAIDAAFTMARRAYGLLVHCSALAAPQYRNEVVLFESCALLEGDRIAAAEATNQFVQLHRRSQAPAPTDLLDLVSDDVMLEGPGEALARDRDAAARFWARHMLDLDVQIRRAVGEDAHRVRIAGRIVTPPDDDGRTTSAPIEQMWTREGGFDFRLRELRVAAFERDPVRD